MEINYERIQELIEHIETIPYHKFDYANWFSDSFGGETDQATWERIRKSANTKAKNPSCNTAGCVAGHACMIWWDEARNFIKNNEDLSIYQIFAFAAQEILGIDDLTRSQLFLREAEYASKSDALNRLKFILKNGNLINYKWEEESYE